jgi:sugar/nucleoside kinase (ribokinase family)
MLGNLTPAVQKRVIEQMETRPRLIALDTMNFWMDSALDSLLEVIGMIDMLIINDEEARQLSGEYSLVKAAEHIQNLGPGTLIIKKGEHGALLFHQEHIFFAPALPLAQVFDPTGAGDTFAGGVMGYLAQSDELTFDNLKRAVIFGSAMASFCVEDFGIQRLRTLSSQEVRDRVHRFAQLVHFEV